MKNKFSPPLDKEIKKFVLILRENGIETYESCECGEGHAYPIPTIRFHGDRSEGFRALSIAIQSGFPVAALNRTWDIIDREPIGPTWEITFFKQNYFTYLLRPAHSWQRGFPPVPCLIFSFSILLPVLQFVLL